MMQILIFISIQTEFWMLSKNIFQANDGVILYILGMFMTFKGVTNYSDVQNDVV